MIITRTPFRVSFAGGGTDLEAFYAKNGYGAVVSAAIKKYMYIVIHPYFHDKIRIKYSKTEDVSSVEEIKHPLVRECLRKVAIDKGLEIASFADIPAGTGLGSSSAFTVGLLHALYAYRGLSRTAEDLAAEACQIEIDILGEPIGKQDQYAAACGGLNHLRFNADGSVAVRPLNPAGESIAALERRLKLYYLGGSRSASKILAEQKAATARADRFAALKEMAGLADSLAEALAAGRLDSLGPCLHQGWLLKQGLASGITDPAIDAAYEAFLAAGAEGGKLLGAGGAGFLLIHAPDHGRLSGPATGLKTLAFELDTQGSTVIFRQ